MVSMGDYGVEAIRLNKFLADAGVCSRREADRYIEDGRVTVNGAVASCGLKVTDTDIVAVDGKPVKTRERTIVLAYYKPEGVTCTEKDTHARITVADAVKYPVRVTYAGRLDRDSEGLLLMTNDGDLIQKMMKGSERHEKEYLVTIDREVTDAFLEKMRAGVYLKELDRTTRPCQAEKVGKYKFRIILTEGLNRQIRRMCKALGAEVKALLRERVLTVTLDGLHKGEYRELSAAEIASLREACGSVKQMP